MNIHLKATLYGAIECWANNQAEEDDWPDVWMGAETVSLMAEAAATVLDAVTEAQVYCIREGYLTQAE